MDKQTQIQNELKTLPLRPVSSRETGPEIIKKMSDFYLNFPFAKTREAAQALGHTPSFVSAIRNSDSFKAYHEPRVKAQTEKRTENILKLEERLTGVVEQAIEQITERLDNADPLENPLKTKELISIVELGMKKLGYDPKTKTPGVQVNIAMVDKKTLEDARERMHQIHAKQTRPQITAQELLTVELDGVVIDADTPT